MGIILVIIGIVLIIIGCKKIDTKEKQIQEIENKINTLNNNFKNQQQLNNNEIYNTEQRIIELKQNEKEIAETIKTFQNNIDENKKRQQEIIWESFENYCDVLDANYQKKEKEYDTLINELENKANTIKEKLVEKVAEERNTLNKLRETRHAQMEAARREKELEEDYSQYTLSIDDLELADIQMLEKIKPRLNKPRVLSMLIWSTFFQKKMTQLCNNIIGTSAKTGIYKITNLETKQCYIGQAKNLADRWKEHAKCGLGIDTPAGNKLYKSMQEDGLWNFAFEVIEYCNSTELNEKEKYYIDLYDSYNFGYNSNKGVSK